MQFSVLRCVFESKVIVDLADLDVVILRDLVPQPAAERPQLPHRSPIAIAREAMSKAAGEWTVACVCTGIRGREHAS